MPTKSLSQVSFFSPTFADPGCITHGSLPWLLREHGSKLWPTWLFRDWHGHGDRGRDAWPARVLMTALVLRAHDGVRHRRAMARRLRRDTTWRAAAELEIGGGSPAESTFRRFERFLQGRDRATGVQRSLLLHEHIVRLCMCAGVVGDGAKWAMDSTPMWCFGAVRGTVRLLGDGLRGLGKLWARATGAAVPEVARQWELPLLLAKSTKGHFAVDWKDSSARAGVVTQLAKSVMRVATFVRSHIERARRNKRKGLLRRCRKLLKVVADDLEVADDGCLVVARRVAPDRLVSITDPEARHSRKSKSRPFRGYRLHLLGDVVSGLIAAVAVTPANHGDSRPAPRLLKRAKRLCNDIERVLGDTAYGGVELHHVARHQLGIDVLAPPQPIPVRKGTIPAARFNLDLATSTAVCPAGVAADMRTGKKGRWFRWSVAACKACSLRAECFGAASASRVVQVHHRHEELQELRARWEKPQTRQQYRDRSRCERLVSRAVQLGARKAVAFGLKAAVRQAHLTVMSNNLALLASAMASADAFRPPATA